MPESLEDFAHSPLSIVNFPSLQVPKVNPYEAPQSDLQTTPPARVGRVDVDRSVRMLLALQGVILVAIVGCYFLGIEPENWVWKFLRMMLLAQAFVSALLVVLTSFNRRWLNLQALELLVLFLALLMYFISSAVMK